MTGIEEDFPRLAKLAATKACRDPECQMPTHLNAREAQRALAELANLRRDVAQLLTWKAAAAAVLEEWEKVWELLDRPGPLGASKARNVYREIAAMRGRPAGRS